MLFFCGLFSSNGWFSRKPVYILTLFIAAGAVVAYAVDASGPPRVKAATVFVLVPLVAWILGGIVLVAVRMSRR